jgi:RND superfamily putative drug exporter
MAAGLALRPSANHPGGMGVVIGDEGTGQQARRHGWNGQSVQFERQPLDQLEEVCSIGDMPAGRAHACRPLDGSTRRASGPTDQAMEELVGEICDRADRYAGEFGIDLGVTGLTAIGIDMSERLADVLPLYLAVVLGLSLLVLLLVFRSVLVPIKATAGFLLSILATFGATTAVFQWGWLNGVFGLDTTTPVMSMLPIIVTGVLYGLAMDYQIFLVSSMRESHVHGHHGTDSVVDGFTQASRVVVAAAVIMIAVFSGFIFNADPMVKQIGFALAIGITIDAFLIRLTLVPAVMSMFGDRAWWLPRWLDRLLPDLDVEGDKLLQQLDRQNQDTPAPDQRTAEEPLSTPSR